MSKWIYKNKKGAFEELAKEFQVHPAIIKILADRGVESREDIKEYLEADMKSVSDGSELTDMNKAVNIIAEAIERRKKIRVMGDYDVDGVTSTYILVSGLKRLGAVVDHFIPHRIIDGYGLHDSAIEQAFKDYVDVILTCDNGISCSDTIGLAKALGMTVVVTDHHEVPYTSLGDGEGTSAASLPRDNEAGIDESSKSSLAKEEDTSAGILSKDNISGLNEVPYTSLGGKRGVNNNEDEDLPLEKPFLHVVEEAKKMPAKNVNEARENVIAAAKEYRVKPSYVYSFEKCYTIPPADAVVDPKRPEDIVFKEICGAVVAYKFMWLLYKKLGREEEFLNSDALEFASLGTVCDVMELQHENRAIVKEGLRRCAKTSNIGLKALLEVLGLIDTELKGYDYGFKIGPCINAEGRLDTANEAFQLFCETDYEKAIEQATKMRELNIERQELTKQGMEEAFKIVDETMASDKVLVVYLPTCHESIAGIIAGKVREKYCKPAFVLTNAGSEGILKGSGRSIEQFSMYDELVKCKDLLLGFGGHPLAAGLSLKEENLKKFREQVNKNCTLTDEDFIAKEYIDVILPVDFLSQGLIKQLDILEPFGKGNEKPMFAQKHVRALSASVIGKNKNVLKVKLNSRTCSDAVCFHNIEETEKYIKNHINDFNILYYPNLNEWNGRVSIQANILDVC